MEPALNEGEALAVLGLRLGAAPEEVDAAHRRLASRAHPDRWLDAPADDREAARARFEEVNAAHRALRGSQGRPPPQPAAPRRRPPAPDPPPPSRPAAAPRPPTGRSDPTDPDVHSDGDGPGLSKGLLVGAALVAVVVLVLVAVGLRSTSPDGARQRSVLGPLAYRYWEAERTGAYATMWDLADPELHRIVGRDEFVAHLELCPPRPAPREVTRIASLGGGLWEVEWVDPAGQPGLGYFRQVGDYAFAAAPNDPDLIEFLRSPLAAARDQPWCRR